MLLGFVQLLVDVLFGLVQLLVDMLLGFLLNVRGLALEGVDLVFEPIVLRLELGFLLFVVVDLLVVGILKRELSSKRVLSRLDINAPGLGLWHLQTAVAYAARHPEVTRVPLTVRAPYVGQEDDGRILTAFDLEQQRRLRPVRATVGGRQVTEFAPGTFQPGSGSVFVGIGFPAGQSGADTIIEATVVHNASTLKPVVYEGHRVGNIEAVGRQTGNIESTCRSALENQIRRSVIIDKLADVAALLAERTECTHKAERSDRAVAHSNADTGVTVTGVASGRASVDVHIHDVLARRLAAVHFRTLQHPIRTNQKGAVGLAETKGVALVLPVHEVGRRVAAHIADAFSLDALATLFAIPIVSIAHPKYAAAVSLYVLAVGVCPDGARGNLCVLSEYRG